MKKRLLKISKYKPSIFQGTFEFSAGSSQVSLSLEHPHERMLLRAISFTLLALICGYLYFVTSSVLNVIARREALVQINNIQSKIGTEEQQYLLLSQGVTPEEGKALGLKPVLETQYVYRTGAADAATIARNAN